MALMVGGAVVLVTLLNEFKSGVLLITDKHYSRIGLAFHVFPRTD